MLQNYFSSEQIYQVVNYLWCDPEGSVLPVDEHPMALPSSSGLAQDRRDCDWGGPSCTVLLGGWCLHTHPPVESHADPDQSSGERLPLSTAGCGLQVPRGAGTPHGRWDVDTKTDQRGSNLRRTPVWRRTQHWWQWTDGPHDTIYVFRSDWCWPAEEHLQWTIGKSQGDPFRDVERHAHRKAEGDKWGFCGSIPIFYKHKFSDCWFHLWSFSKEISRRLFSSQWGGQGGCLPPIIKRVQRRGHRRAREDPTVPCWWRRGETWRSCWGWGCGHWYWKWTWCWDSRSNCREDKSCDNSYSHPVWWRRHPLQATSHKPRPSQEEVLAATCQSHPECWTGLLSVPAGSVQGCHHQVQPQASAETLDTRWQPCSPLSRHASFPVREHPCESHGERNHSLREEWITVRPDNYHVLQWQHQYRDLLWCPRRICCPGYQHGNPSATQSSE